MTKDEQKRVFEKLGETIFWITQDADAQVYERWAKMGLTRAFADYIIMEYRILAKITPKINNQQ